jgi:ATP-dependent DNA helicase RecG
VREALLNAVSHRDYRSGSSIFVRQYPQRLEVVSPGGFPPGVTVENLLEAQNPRNRRLATALQKCGLIERSGQGMNLMFEHAIRQGKALPDFSGTSASEVKLCLRGAVTTPAFVRFLERLGGEKLKSFATDDFLALDHLRRDIALSAPLKARLPGLVQAGAVEAVGRGRGTKHILARSLYAALGGKGTYTRKKGLDRATNKALLLQHIKENAATGSQMKEFLEVLPAVGGRDVIKVLLRELRRDGAIHVLGAKKSARWYPS